MDTSHGINFAVAGSTATDQSFFVKQNVTFYVPKASLNVQLGWFKMFLESHGCHRQPTISKECTGLMDNALFWVGEIGANIMRIPSELLEMGAKNVVMEGLSPTGCLPLALTLAPTDDRDDIGCVRSANKQSYNHNTQLQANLQYLKKQYPQSIISYADYFAAYRTVMKNTNKYGFKEPFKCCCGSGDICMYKVVAEMFIHGGYMHPSFF
ncbi:hypothetical protein MKX01_004746 [Papaver californicum]|nr:hypothetical protein MKX01_004746 [Papaver californicum]